MSTNAHNKIYTAADIQNYLAGILTPLQMNAMEKAALEDPLLAEAMEGYAGMQNDDWKKNVTDLKESFAQKQQGAKVIPIGKKRNNWLKVAAAVIIIGGLSTVSYLLLNKNQPQEIAKSNEQKPATTSSADTVKFTNNNTATETEKSNGSLAIIETPQVNPSKTIIKDVTRIPVETVADSAFVYVPQPAKPAAKDMAAANKKDDYIAAEKKSAEEPATGNNAAVQKQNASNNANTEAAANRSGYEADYYKKERKDKNAELSAAQVQLNRSFNALVSGTDNTPLPFANINIKSENFGTYADVRGNFRLLSNDSVLTVEVRAAGFKPQTVMLKSNVQQNKITLTEDNTSFRETTVIASSNGKSKELRRSALVKDSAMNVEPADGWDNYNSYVDNNIEIPDDILKNNIHGQVELSFDVKSNGTITNIKVDKTLCSNCDEAAIKLLQQGPQWKVKKGKKGKGKITVQF